MTLEDLRTFIVAYQKKNLSEAARHLGCTQGAVAQHVRRLEKELSTELFLRVPRGIMPTSLGQILYEGASSGLANIDLALEEIDRSLKNREGRLSLAVSAMAASGFLRPFILSMKKKHPDLNIEVVVGNTAEQRLCALREGKADLAIIPLVESAPGFEVKLLTEIELLLLVHKSHPFADRKRLRIPELKSIKYIAQSTSSTTYRHLEKSLKESGIILEPSQIVADPAAAILMVELGEGETFIAAGQKADVEKSDLVKAITISSLPDMKTVWASRNFALLPEAAIAFVNELEQTRERKNA